MTRPSSKRVATAGPIPATHDLAYRAGRGLFIAAIVLTPLVLGLLPAQFGAVAAYRAFDPVDLPKIAALLVLVGASFAAWCVSVVRGAAQPFWHRALWGIFGLIAWASVSTVFSASRALSVWGVYDSNEGLVAMFAFGVVAFLCVQYARSMRDLQVLLAAVVSAGVLVALYAAAQFFGVDPLQWAGELGRAFSTFGNADVLGTYLVFPFGCALALALSAADRRGRVLAWIAAAVIAFALYATGTRGAWLGALATIGCVAVLSWSGWAAMRPARRAALVAGVVALLGVVVTAVVFTRPRSATSSPNMAVLLSDLSNGRTAIWSTAWRAFAARPITGWGPDAFERAFQFAVRADWFSVTQGIEVPHNAHSLLVQTLVTLGLPGLLILVGTLGYVWVSGYRSIPTKSGPARGVQLGLWATFVGAVVALSVAVTLGAVTVWLWLVLGLLVASSATAASVRVPKPVVAAGVVLGVGVAIWSSTWLVADVQVGYGMNLAPGPEQIATLAAASRLNPLVINYRWIAAESYVSSALAAQKAGATPSQVDSMIAQSFPAYEDALAADTTNALVRTAYANVLVGYAARHPETNAAQRAVAVAGEAVALAPYNPATLAALARAYRVSGQLAKAEETARLARSIAPEYSSQTLGTLGQGAQPTP
ncbi:MAG: O-antigen ligase family protein [Coriobacteriia bacterium]|nr:O-antigen ligase family protein [Coriobacteriia bacterium]